MLNELANSSISAAKLLVVEIGSYAIKLIVAVLVIFIGWVISKTLQSMVVRGLKTCRVDLASEKVGIKDFLAQGGIHQTLSELIGVFIYWLALLMVLAISVNFLGLSVVTELLKQVILYIPNIIVSIFVILIGMFLSGFLSTLVSASASSAGITQARALSRLVQVIIMFFTIIVALEQLKIGTSVILWTVNILIAAIGLGLALAFGLGCKDIVKDMTAHFINSFKKR